MTTPILSTIAAVLDGAPVITTATAPVKGNINSYNATAGALSITLPPLASQNAGAFSVVEKSTLDTTMNAVTFTASGSDTFDDGRLSLGLMQPGERRHLQVVSISGVLYWKVVYGLNPKTPIAVLTSEVSLANSTTLTPIIAATLSPGALFAGSTYRIKAFGTYKCKATSGILTLTPYIQGTALNAIVVATQGSAQGPVGFELEILITVRSTGSSGSAIAHGKGLVNLTALTMLTSTNTTATTVNTTATASSTVLELQAQWATADTANVLAIEIASIERVM